MNIERQLLERALRAEEARDEAERRAADMEVRLRGALNADPSTATRALSWVGRAEAAEQLVSAVLRHVGQRSLEATALPPGWVSRATAQMKAVEVLQRDLQHLIERPPDTDYWTTGQDALGRRSIVTDKELI